MRAGNPFSWQRLDAPGTILLYQAVFDALAGRLPGAFLEVGCGYGSLTRRMIERGWHGHAIDYEAPAVEAAKQHLAPELASGKLTVAKADLWTLEPDDLPVRPDIAYAMMVIEHIEEDKAFVLKMASLVKPGGLVLVGVPGGQRFWNFEDETVGHLRRYDQSDLAQRFDAPEFDDGKAWSVGVPLSNWTFKIGDALLRRSAQADRAGLSQEEQTRKSWDINVPFKTVYPRFFGWIFHERTLLAPFSALQRAYYDSNSGTVMLGIGAVAAADRSDA